ncbi:hypothetical protein GDO86_019553, partial [Hymenochirus boettgeri]
RLPSTWLTPSMNVLDIIRIQSSSGKKQTSPLVEKRSNENSSGAERSLRALCDHSGSDQAQLSFRKGDVLQLLGTVDEDWIQCRRGNDIGLVPVGYTSLIL